MEVREHVDERWNFEFSHSEVQNEHICFKFRTEAEKLGYESGVFIL